MRTDESLLSASGVTEAPSVERNPVPGLPPGFKIGSSFSGHERDRLFISSDASRFDDVSAISGLDHIGDSRVSSFFDFDRDGMMDIALASANAPMLQILRNNIATVSKRPNRFIAVRLVGGNDTAQPMPGFSTRDGVGAKVRVAVGSRVLLRERHVGEGFAGQNSATLIVGIGEHAAADRVLVTWPGGIEQETVAVPAGTLLTVYESPAQSPTGDAFVSISYGSAIPIPEPPAAVSMPVELPGSATQADAQLRMYTTMATWCGACRAEIPELQELRAVFSSSDLAMFGVPADPNDTTVKLSAYIKDHLPPYELLLDLSPETIERVIDVGRERLGEPGLPMTVVVDRDGRVELVRLGTPTVSELRRLLRR